MFEKLKQLFSPPPIEQPKPSVDVLSFWVPEEEEEVQIPAPPRRIDPLIKPEDVAWLGSSIVAKLDYDKIRRTLMLFDIRWLNEQFQSYIPDNQQIAEFVGQLSIRLMKHGRIIGPCIIRDRGFLATYGHGANGEVISIEYILTGTSTLD